jgi:MoxR-like ATPase
LEVEVESELVKAQGLVQKIIDNMQKVVIGKRSAIELGLVALLSQGHLLIEDVPGVGKTMFARSLSKSIGCTFKRIQFTPDLLPGDITGVSVYNQKENDFEFRPGPIIAQVVLADEINRATP